jgi:hypothetical protein
VAPALPPRRVSRALVVWALLCLVAAPSFAGGGGGLLLGALLGAFAAAAAALGSRSALFLTAAREGRAVLNEGAPSHSLWRGALLPLCLAVVVGGVLGVVQGLAAPSYGSAAALLLAATAAGNLLAVPFVRKELARPRSPRSSSLVEWLVVDGALPGGVLAAAFGVLAALHRDGEGLTASEAARHLALTLFAYAVLLGMAGALKAGRERGAGLVRAPEPPSWIPGPLAVGGLLGIVVLLVGPRLLGPVSVEQLAVTKAFFGLGLGTLLGALGGARGATNAAD